MRKKLLIVSIFVVLMSVSLLIATACESKVSSDLADEDIRGGETNTPDNIDESGNSMRYTFTFYATVRDAYFAEVGERNLLYEGNTVCLVKDGVFEVSVEVGDEGFDKTKLSTDRTGCTFVITEMRDSITEHEDITKTVYTIIEVEDGKACDGFMDIGGKVVLHSDGETRVSGATLCIDGNVVIESSEGNFNLHYIPVGAKFSALYDGFATVDILQNELPYHVITNGVEVYTFRLVPVTN